MDDFDLFEKAVSASQQRLMGAVHAYQKYGTVPKNASFAAKVKGIADGGKPKKRGKGKTKGMKKSSATDYAETKHKGLPEKVSETFAQFVEHSGDDWVHRSYEERIGMSQGDANKFRKRLGRGLLKRVRSLGPARRSEPTSWGHDVKRRAFRTVSDAIKRRFSEAAVSEPFPMGGGREPGYRNLGSIAQEVWEASGVDEKRQLVHEMINTFKYKDKQVKYRRIADSINVPGKLDSLASNLMLADEKVIK